MAIPKITVSGPVEAPGSLVIASGTVTARLSESGSALDGATPVSLSLTERASIARGGQVSLQLTPNDIITPEGTTWLVEFDVVYTDRTRDRWTQRWSVPSSPTSFTPGAAPRIYTDPHTAVRLDSAVQAAVVAAASASASEAAASQSAAAASAAATALAQFAAQAYAAEAQAHADSVASGPAEWPDTATALPLVAEGAYFSTPSPNQTESSIRYRKVAGVAVEVARYPSQVIGDQAALAGGAAAADEYPNLIGDTSWTGSAWAANRTVVNGRACVSITSTTKSIRVPRSMIAGSVISANLRVESMAASSGTPRILLQQRTAALAEIVPSRQTKLLGTAAITNPTSYQFSGVSLDPTCAFIDLYFEAGVGALVVSQPGVFEGTIAHFRTAPRRSVVNRFTDPLFRGIDMLSGGAGARTTESYEPVCSFTGGITERNYWIPTAGAMQPGATVFLNAEVWGDVASTASVAMYFLDSAGADLGSSVSSNNGSTLSAWVPTAKSAVIPANCAYVHVRFTKTGAATLVKVRRVALSTEYFAGQAVLLDLPKTVPSQVWLSPTGSDLNSGDASSPLASIDKAIAMLQGRGRIVMQNGDYSGAAVATSLDNATDIEIAADGSVRPRIIGGTKLGTITKTPGYSKVYQAALGAAPTVPWLWEHEVPEVGTLISAAERHALHRGRVYRLPSTRISQVASIAAIDAAATPSWYWSGGVIYFSIASGGDATSSSIYLPSASGGGITRSSAKKDVVRLQLAGIEVWYGILQLTGTEYVARDLLTVGSYGNGIASNMARGREIRCEFAGASNDGGGAHGQPEPTWPWSPVEQSTEIVDPYWHDNGDDGWSLHERCSATIVGGLTEYNTGCGIAPAYGAHVTAYGLHTRRNDPLGAKGGGVGAIGATTGLEGGVGTQVRLVNCLVEDEVVGINAGAGDATVDAIGCRTARCGTAYKATSVGSVVNLKDCLDSGSTAVKGGLGTINVSNGAVVT